MIRKISKVGAGSLLGTAGYLYATDPSLSEKTSRFAYTSYNVVITAADYQFSLLNYHSLDYYLEHRKNEDLKDEFQKYRRQVKKCNIRAAKRLYKVCNHHGGIYNKFGQYVSSLNNVLPKEAIDIIKPLQDRAKPLKNELAEKVINFEIEKLSGDKKEVFEEINLTPIASASLAQVHEAVLTSGEKVAVKIQYPKLERQVDADFSTIHFLTKFIGALFPQFEYSWIIPEFEENLRVELNFLQEAKNGQRMGKLLNNLPNLYVPKYFTQVSTKKMLVMEFVAGTKIDMKEEIVRKVTKDTNAVAKVVSKAFGDMIHVHGLVHCDPHPGNLLVRKNLRKPSGFEVILLDHGMYRRLENSFRVTYCLLWKALLERDETLGRKVVTNLAPGLRPEDYDIFSLSLTYRFPSRKKEFRRSNSVITRSNMTKEDLDQLRDRFGEMTMQSLNDFLRRLPTDLHFVLRTTNLVRSLNNSLGGTSRERFRIMGNSALEGLEVSNFDEDLENLEENVANLTGEEKVNRLVASEKVRFNVWSLSVMFEKLKLKLYLSVFDFLLPLLSFFQGKELDDNFAVVSLEDIE
eukprot:maker-scaffold_16-snap-gene-6.26-mRNA-1 protein AED:0.08 eAED:0.08 QI:44/1/1/1/0.5/0.33/3/168/574